YSPSKDFFFLQDDLAQHPRRHQAVYRDGGVGNPRPDASSYRCSGGSPNFSARTFRLSTTLAASGIPSALRCWVAWYSGSPGMMTPCSGLTRLAFLKRVIH